MLYGFVSKGKSFLTHSWKEIQEYARIMPYCQYRKFYDEDEAWQYVMARTPKNKSLYIKRYGDLMDSHYVSVNYIITPEAVYYNIDLNKSFLSKISLDSEDGISIMNYRNMITIKNTQLRLNPHSLKDTCIALHFILRVLGPYVDIELYVPDMSTFYLITYYEGSVYEYKKLKDLLKSRIGRVGVTVECRQFAREDEESRSLEGEG